MFTDSKSRRRGAHRTMDPVRVPAPGRSLVPRALTLHTLSRTPVVYPRPARFYPAQTGAIAQRGEDTDVPPMMERGNMSEDADKCTC